MLEHLTEKETLPVGDEDRILPTRIAKMEQHIAFLNEQRAQIDEQIRMAEFDRNAMIARAKECHITTDSEYKILEVPIYPKKRVDVERLKQYPDKYSKILANIAERIKDKAASEAAKAETFISQSDVKAVIRDKGILAMVIPETSEPTGYETKVVKR